MKLVTKQIVLKTSYRIRHKMMNQPNRQFSACIWSQVKFIISDQVTHNIRDPIWNNYRTVG